MPREKENASERARKTRQKMKDESASELNWERGERGKDEDEAWMQADERQWMKYRVAILKMKIRVCHDARRFSAHDAAAPMNYDALVYYSGTLAGDISAKAKAKAHGDGTAKNSCDVNAKGNLCSNEEGLCSSSTNWR